MTRDGTKDRGDTPHLKLVASDGLTADRTDDHTIDRQENRPEASKPGERASDTAGQISAKDANSDGTAGEAAPGNTATGTSNAAGGDSQQDLQPVSAEAVRMVEAIVFASPTALFEKQIAEQVPHGLDVAGCLASLQQQYQGRGIELVRVAGRWQFRTASDLRHLLERNIEEKKKLSRAALETLAIIAYHQPVTRAEIEEVRGVSTSAGTVDILLDTGWVRMRGRRRAPGRPVTYGTTDAFLEHFGLDTVRDLPGLNELKGAGLLTSRLPAGFEVPEPVDVADLLPDELPLEEEEDEDRPEVAPEDEPDSDDEPASEDHPPGPLAGRVDDPGGSN